MKNPAPMPDLFTALPDDDTPLPLDPVVTAQVAEWRSRHPFMGHDYQLAAAKRRPKSD